jgi:YfiH family protein
VVLINNKYNFMDKYKFVDKEVPYITFPALSSIPFIRHGFSTRLGGVSEDIFSTMNLGFLGQYQDNPDKVIENYRRISKSMGIDPTTIVMAKQVHKTNIRVVDKEDWGKGIFRQRDFDEIDGLITNTPNVTLVTTYADCVPIYLVDPVKKAIGLSHSGWRGTVKKIGRETVDEMHKHFNSNPKDLIAVIGPSICQQCFEIGDDVAEEFYYAFNLDGDNDILVRASSGKYHGDLWKANQRVLLDAGLMLDNIHICGVCTCCNPELLFSHRKSNGKRGSLAAFLSIELGN